jgi:hypothetical protein
MQVPPPNVPPPLMRGKQEFDPPPEETAPLGTPFEKDRVLLQVGSGGLVSERTPSLLACDDSSRAPLNFPFKAN